MTPVPPAAPIGIYLHIPFCAHICPYCDFNTYAGQEGLIPAYLTAVEREIAWHGEAYAGQQAGTIFFGGGTPSLLAPAEIGRLVAACRTSFDLAADAEVTLEANPTSVDADYFGGLLAAGVNRVSLGVQTQQRRGLRVLGRNHEAADAATAFLAARTAGFANISLDLIFGWPGQTLAAWAHDLDTVLAWGDAGPEHLSLYSLIVEPGTPMADAVKRGILTVPDDDATADLYEAAIAKLARAGYHHYEVANWAKTTSLRSRHNLIYWRNGDYAGIGAGAHGHTSRQPSAVSRQSPVSYRLSPTAFGAVVGRRTMNHLLPSTYIAAVERGEAPVSNVEGIPARTAMGETMMLGLRLLDEGVTDAAFAVRHGLILAEIFGDEIARLVEQGLIEREPGRIRLTPRGLMLANEVCARFV